ncbi:MAG: hypothetical protein DMD77_14700 [Candidatus Rokuibacteriota bacterium]|nr:MAG: hypothetical protein DMD77_14700 [Candidatus Rokubacteria bacterium]
MASRAASTASPDLEGYPLGISQALDFQTPPSLLQRSSSDMLAHPAMPTATIIRMAAIQDLFLMMPSHEMSTVHVVSADIAGQRRAFF